MSRLSVRVSVRPQGLRLCEDWLAQAGLSSELGIELGPGSRLSPGTESGQLVTRVKLNL